MAPFPEGGGQSARPAGDGRDGRPPRPVAHIDQTRCDRSPACPVRRICPKQAVVPDESGAPGQGKSILSFLGFGGNTAWKVDENKCTGCLLCASYCPHAAVQPRRRDVA